MSSITDKFHSGVNALCRRCKLIFTIHPSECKPDEEYQCEGCDHLAANEIPKTDEPIAPDKAIATLPPAPEPEVLADHPEDAEPKVAAVFPEGDKDRVIDHVTVPELVERDAEQHGESPHEEAEASDASSTEEAPPDIHEGSQPDGEVEPPASDSEDARPKK